MTEVQTTESHPNPPTAWQEIYQLNITRPLGGIWRGILEIYALSRTVVYDVLHPGKALLRADEIPHYLSPPKASRAILKLLIFLLSIQALVLLFSDHYQDLQSLFHKSSVVGTTEGAEGIMNVGGMSNDLPTEELDELMVDAFLVLLYFVSLGVILLLGYIFRQFKVFKYEDSRTISYLLLSQFNILFFWVCFCLLLIMIIPPSLDKEFWIVSLLSVSFLIPLPITAFHFRRYRKYCPYNVLRGILAWCISWLALTFLVSFLFDACVMRLFLHMEGFGLDHH